LSIQQEAVAAAVEQGIPTVSVPFFDEPVPLVSPKGVLSWSLVNLLLALIGILLALIVLIMTLARRKRAAKRNDGDAAGAYAQRERNVADEHPQREPNSADAYMQSERNAPDEHPQRKLNISLIAALALAVLGAVFFLLIEDMNLAVALFDAWTSLFAAVLAAEAIAVAFAFRKEKATSAEAIGANEFKSV
jgi:Flp pilus assembly protein TadB